MKKKTFLAMTLCAAVLALTLAGCGSDKPDNDNSSSSVSVSDNSNSGDSSSSDEQSSEPAGDLTVYNENGLEFSYPSSWMKTNTNTAAGDTIVVMPEDSAGDSVAVMVQDLGTKVPAVKDYINAVSYTHLDVYKRQLVDMVFRPDVFQMVEGGHDFILFLQSYSSDESVNEA